MDLQENVERIYEKLINMGYTSPKLLMHDLKTRHLDFDVLFSLFSLDDTFPNIVPNNDFESNKNWLLFSGTKNFQSDLSNIQKGKFRTNLLHNKGVNHGIGYYFTHCKDVAEGYCCGKEGGIINAKLFNDKMIINKYELMHLLCENGFLNKKWEPQNVFPSLGHNISYKKKKNVVARLSTAYGIYETLFALMLGYGGVSVFCEDYGYSEYAIADRRALIMPQSQKDIIALQ